MRFVIALLALIFLLAAAITALVLLSPRDVRLPEPTPIATTVPEFESETGVFSIEPDLDENASVAIGTVVTSPVSSPAASPNATACPQTEVTDPIVIEVFDDFLCPYCARQFVENLQPISQSEEFNGQPLQFEFITLPIHGEASAVLAKAAWCSEQLVDPWQFRTKLYAAPEKTPVIAQTLLVELGGDETRYETCLISQEAEDALQQAIMYARELGVDATPTLRIDKEMYVGIVPRENIAHLIRKILAATPQKSLECGR